MPLRTFVYAPILTSTVTNKINVQFAHVCHLITFTNISDTAAKTNFFSVWCHMGTDVFERGGAGAVWFRA